MAVASGSLLERIVCPGCAAPLAAGGDPIRCRSCDQIYPRLGAIPVLLPRPESWLRRWALELALLEREGESQLAGLEASLASPDLLPCTLARCQAMLKAARDQAAEIRAVLRSQFSGRVLGEGAVPAEEITSPLTRLHYLFRDWGWEGGRHPENQGTLEAVAEVAGGAPLGRTLVLGAGAGRLAYDLVLRLGARELAAVDLDPVLFSFAEAIVRGRTLRLTEPSAPAYEASSVARTWELAAPAGPLGPEVFQLFLADGMAPPFAPGSFDCVVTAWFADHVPNDLRDLLGAIGGLLVPGGRWINHGPLIYPPRVPLARRFTREEVLELAARAGLRPERWRTDSGPHLVSPLNRRGRVEWCLTFAARREVPPAGQPPGWLLFSSWPVPSFPGQSLFWHENPLIRLVVGAVDGQRSIDDLQRALVAEVQALGLDPRDLKEAIRQVLAAVHPACRN